ncbi:hypothetical protein ES708_20341 [subsurface metagenome]
MKRTLILIILVVSIFTMVNPIAQDQDQEFSPVSSEIPVQEFVDSGEQKDVTVRFDRELSQVEIEFYKMNGINFGDTLQHVGSVYLAKVSDVALEHLQNDPSLESVEPLHNPKYQMPRDISVPGTETYTDLAWDMQDYYGLNLTGKDILIADLDTGIQWRHPDFFFADGGTFSWLDVVASPPWLFINGTDGIDLNSNFIISANETLYSIDVDGDGNFNCDVDWIYLDNGTTIGSIDDGDTFFVVDDDGDNQLNSGRI